MFWPKKQRFSGMCRDALFPFLLAMSQPEPKPQLRSLTTLKWPFVEDEDKSFEDPLTRNDPKRLRTAHYEGIGACIALRRNVTLLT